MKSRDKNFRTIRQSEVWQNVWGAENWRRSCTRSLKWQNWFVA